MHFSFSTKHLMISLSLSSADVGEFIKWINKKGFIPKKNA